MNTGSSVVMAEFASVGSLMLLSSLVGCRVVRPVAFPGLVAILNSGVLLPVALFPPAPPAAGGVVVVVLSLAPAPDDGVVFLLWWLYLVMSRAFALILLALKLSLPLELLSNLVILYLVIVMLLLASG